MKKQVISTKIHLRRELWRCQFTFFSL